MAEPRWKYAKVTVMEEVADLIYAIISWKYAKPTMMIYPSATPAPVIPTNLSILMGLMEQNGTY